MTIYRQLSSFSLHNFIIITRIFCMIFKHFNIRIFIWEFLLPGILSQNTGETLRRVTYECYVLYDLTLSIYSIDSRATPTAVRSFFAIAIFDWIRMSFDLA